MAAVVAITVYVFINAHKPATVAAPLRVVGNISVQMKPGAKVGCNASVSFTASGSVTGAGNLEYQWERSDGTAPVTRQIPVSPDDTTFTTDTVFWSFIGSQHLDATMTFHLLKPTDRKVTSSFREDCA